MPYVYILISEKGKYYIGSTINLVVRMAHHKGGYTPSTKRMGNVKLIFSQEYPTLKIARQIERRIKKLKRKVYVEKIVKEGKITMHI